MIFPCGMRKRVQGIIPIHKEILAFGQTFISFGIRQHQHTHRALELNGHLGMVGLCGSRRAIHDFFDKRNGDRSYDHFFVIIDIFGSGLCDFTEFWFLSGEVGIAAEDEDAHIRIDACDHIVNQESAEQYTECCDSEPPLGMVEPVADFLAVTFTAVLFTFQFKKSIKLISN